MFFFKKMQKNLVNSEKSSTFALAFDRERLSIEKNGVLPLLRNRSVLCPIEGHAPLLNGVMVALQILVLSVWVRVLVEQQKI